MKGGKHWLQFWHDATKSSLKLTRYNYRDPYLNQKAYGFVSPPEYDLSKIKEKVNFWMGQHDKVLVRKDLDLLVSYMKNADVHVTYIKGWGHCSVMFPKSREPFDRMMEMAKKDMMSSA